MNKSEVIELVREVVDEFNASETKKKISIEENTKLYGINGILSSIELVTLLVEIEYKLEEKFGVSGVLTNEKAMSQENSPFRSIDSLIDYICLLEMKK